MTTAVPGLSYFLLPTWLLCSACATGGFAASPAVALKASAGGELSQATRIGGRGTDTAVLADCAPDGSLTVLGDTYRSVGDDFELLAVRLAPDRRLEWVKALGRGNKEQMVSALRAADGGFLIAGGSTSLVMNPFPTMSRAVPLVVKLNAAAVPEWAALVGRTEWAAITALVGLVSTEDGGAVLVGRLVRAPSFAEMEPALLKLDAHGLPVWSHSLPLGTPGLADAVAALPGGDLVVAGSVERPEGVAGPKLGIFVARLTPDGTPRWARKLSVGRKVIAARQVMATGDGFVVLADAGGHGTGIAALRFSGSGLLEWSRLYTDAESNRLASLALAVDGSGDIVLAGSTGAADGLRGAVLLVGPDGALKASSSVVTDGPVEVVSVKPLTGGRICLALNAKNRGGGMLTAFWKPVSPAGASRFHGAPLEVNHSEFELRAVQFQYRHVPLPDGTLQLRSLELPGPGH